MRQTTAAAACLLLLVPTVAWLVASREGTAVPLLPGQGTAPSSRHRGGSAGPTATEAFWLLLGACGFSWLLRLLAAVLLGLNIPYLLDLYIYFPVAVAAAVGFLQVVREAEVREFTMHGEKGRGIDADDAADGGDGRPRLDVL